MDQEDKAQASTSDVLRNTRSILDDEGESDSTKDDVTVVSLIKDEGYACKVDNETESPDNKPRITYLGFGNDEESSSCESENSDSPVLKIILPSFDDDKNDNSAEKSDGDENRSKNNNETAEEFETEEVLNSIVGSKCKKNVSQVQHHQNTVKVSKEKVIDQDVVLNIGGTGCDLHCYESAVDLDNTESIEGIRIPSASDLNRAVRESGPLDVSPVIPPPIPCPPVGSRIKIIDTTLKSQKKGVSIVVLPSGALESKKPSHATPVPNLVSAADKIELDSIKVVTLPPPKGSNTSGNVAGSGQTNQRSTMPASIPVQSLLNFVAPALKTNASSTMTFNLQGSKSAPASSPAMNISLSGSKVFTNSYSSAPPIRITPSASQTQKFAPRVKPSSTFNFSAPRTAGCPNASGSMQIPRFISKPFTLPPATNSQVFVVNVDASGKIIAGPNDLEPDESIMLSNPDESAYGAKSQNNGTNLSTPKSVIEVIFSAANNIITNKSTDSKNSAPSTLGMTFTIPKSAFSSFPSNTQTSISSSSVSKEISTKSSSQASIISSNGGDLQINDVVSLNGSNAIPGTSMPYRTPGSMKVNRHGNIKRPMNAFMVWARHARPKLAAEMEGAHNSQISMRLGQIWNEMTESAKSEYYAEAERIKLNHKLTYPDWSYRPKVKKVKNMNQTPSPPPQLSIPRQLQGPPLPPEWRIISQKQAEAFVPSGAQSEDGFTGEAVVREYTLERSDGNTGALKGRPPSSTKRRNDMLKEAGPTSSSYSVIHGWKDEELKPSPVGPVLSETSLATKMLTLINRSDSEQEPLDLTMTTIGSMTEVSGTIEAERIKKRKRGSSDDDPDWQDKENSSKRKRRSPTQRQQRNAPRSRNTRMKKCSTQTSTACQTETPSPPSWPFPFSSHPLNEHYAEMAQAANAELKPFAWDNRCPAGQSASNSSLPDYDPYNPLLFGNPQRMRVQALKMQRWIEYLTRTDDGNFMAFRDSENSDSNSSLAPCSQMVENVMSVGKGSTNVKNKPSKEKQQLLLQKTVRAAENSNQRSRNVVNISPKPSMAQEIFNAMLQCDNTPFLPPMPQSAAEASLSWSSFPKFEDYPGTSFDFAPNAPYFGTPEDLGFEAPLDLTNTNNSSTYDIPWWYYTQHARAMRAFRARRNARLGKPENWAKQGDNPKPETVTSAATYDEEAEQFTDADTEPVMIEDTQPKEERAEKCKEEPSITEGKATRLKIAEKCKEETSITEDKVTRQQIAEKCKEGPPITEDKATRQENAEKCKKGTRITEDKVTRQKIPEKCEEETPITEDKVTRQEIAEKCKKGTRITDDKATRQEIAEKCKKGPPTIEDTATRQKIAEKCKEGTLITEDKATRQEISEECKEEAPITEDKVTRQKIAEKCQKKPPLTENKETRVETAETCREGPLDDTEIIDVVSEFTGHNGLIEVGEKNTSGADKQPSAMMKLSREGDTESGSEEKSRFPLNDSKQDNDALLYAGTLVGSSAGNSSTTTATATVTTKVKEQVLERTSTPKDLDSEPRSSKSTKPQIRESTEPVRECSSASTDAGTDTDSPVDWPRGRSKSRSKRGFIHPYYQRFMKSMTRNSELRREWLRRSMLPFSSMPPDLREMFDQSAGPSQPLDLSQ